jgi:RNA polymerase-associated protein
MNFEIRDVDLYSKPEEIGLMNPYSQVPILVERDLILYESNIINEYVDDRFPHPQLMFGDPAERARIRIFMLNFEKELFAYVSELERLLTKKNDKKLQKVRQHIVERLTQMAPIFLSNTYVIGETFSILDVMLAPLLWRVEHYGIRLQDQRQIVPLLKYAERIFSRPGFIQSLTPSEKAMRK